MSDAVDLSSMIGTWVGAGIGIIALIGILGPVLVWLASRTERQKTLNAMGRDTNGYISPGWHLGPNIYLGQRMKAPDLMRAGPRPNGIFNGVFRLKTSSLTSFSTEANWVHFGALLEAYDMTFMRRGDVMIQSGKTYLPIHPSWILAVGLLGRYSTQRSREERRSSKKFTLGTGIPRPSGLTRPKNRLGDSDRMLRDAGRQMRGRTPPPLRYPPPPLSVHYAPARDSDSLEYAMPAMADVRAHARDGGSLERHPSSTLYGITGSFKAHGREQKANGPFPTLRYHPSSTTTHSETHADVLPMRDLFLLSIGLVRIRDDQYVSLADFHTYEEWDDRSVSSFQSSDGPEDPVISRYQREPQQILPVVTDRDIRVTYRVCVFRLGSLDIPDPLVKMSGPFADLSLGHDYMGFTPDYDRKKLEYVTQLEGSTYVSADDAWVRVVKGRYVPRVDAQRLALALLKIPWTRKSYLIGGYGSDVAMNMIMAASNRLQPMLVRLQDKIWLLDLTEQDKKRLSTVVDPVIRRLDRGSVDHDLQTFRKLYELHTTVLEMGSPETQAIADQAVAILCITNEEFRHIVHQSIRNLKESATVAIDLDLKSMTLKVPSAFGVRQHFHLDWNAITDTTSSPRPHGTVPVKHTAIVLASVRSLVVCMMLMTCSDARPLLELVQGFDDLVYMD